ncbi:MAG TPA: endonuclease/exonuclease/phosphatase family protein [Caulobacteraceae bacterium]
MTDPQDQTSAATAATLMAELRYAAAQTVRSVVWLTALGTLLIALSGLFGAVDRRLDLFNQLAPLWLCLGLASALAGLLVERRAINWPAALGLAGALIAAGMMAPELAAAARADHTQPSGRTLKIIQLNAFGENRQPARTARWILAQDADIVLMEEVGNSPIRKMLRARYPYQITCAHPAPCAPMIFLKAPPAAHGGSSIPPKANLTWVTLGGEDGFTIVAVHQAKPWDPIQPEQIGLTAALLKTFDQSDLVVAGDFNNTPWTWSMKDQDRAFGIERRTRALASWPTWSPLPITPIDHVYAGQAWNVDVARGPMVGSDHYPLVITLSRGSAAR